MTTSPSEQSSATDNNGVPDQATLTEHEWFAVDWTAEQLYQQYHDESIDEGRREHAFWRFWSRRIKPDSNYILDDGGVEELGKYHQWSGVLGNIAGELAWQNRLTTAQCHTLLTLVTTNTWATNQLQSRLLLRDETLTWQEKFDAVLENEKLWGAAELIDSMPPEEKERVTRRIQESNLSIKLKPRLLAKIMAQK